MYLFPVLLLGSGPTMSMVLLLSGSSVIGNGMRGMTSSSWSCHLTFRMWSVVVSHIPVEHCPIKLSQHSPCSLILPRVFSHWYFMSYRSNTGFIHCIGKTGSSSPLLPGCVQQQYNRPSRLKKPTPAILALPSAAVCIATNMGSCCCFFISALVKLRFFNSTPNEVDLSGYLVNYSSSSYVPIKLLSTPASSISGGSLSVSISTWLGFAPDASYLPPFL